MWMLIPIAVFACFLQVDSRAVYNESGDIADAKAKEVCMKELGCFAITDDFKSLRNRPINVLPHDRVTINTKFLLYTKRNAKESHRLYAGDKSSIKDSNFDPKVKTIFIVHGFMDGEIFGPWMSRMKDEFLLREQPANIIIVDWSGGNKPPYYQATANTRVVGAELAVLIEALEKHTGIKREDCHVIGHSLGSHIAGYAGARLKTLGRITGCDPAEPYFQNMPATVRLDHTDALFVDVIHSDTTSILLLGFGMSQKVGHVDFFPNNGRKQPGCKVDRFKTFITEGLKEGVRRFSSCNHQRSLDFMHHSINYNKALPVAFECPSWEDFLNGKCADCGTDTRKCAVMGFRADEYIPFKNKTVHRTMYLKTSGKSPFWLYHYQVNVKLFKAKSSKDVKGTIDITLTGSKNDELSHVQSKATDLYHGSRYQYLVTTDKELGDIKSVSFKWFSSSLRILSKPKLYVEYIEVIPMNAIEKSPRDMSGRVFCDKAETGIDSKKQAIFLPGKKCVK